jgi:hypothetical protein
MKNIIYSATPFDGVINIPLQTSCICDIGLVSITLSYTSRNKVDQFYRDLEISCEQVDSTEFETILFFPIDSTDKKSTIRISDQYGPLFLAGKTLQLAGKTHKKLLFASNHGHKMAITTGKSIYNWYYF